MWFLLPFIDLSADAEVSFVVYLDVHISRMLTKPLSFTNVYLLYWFVVYVMVMSITTSPIRKKYIRIQWEYSVDDSLTINWPSIDPWLNFSHANEGAVNSFAYSRNQLTIVECSSILCAVDHCWILLYFPCGWPLLNAPIFSVRLTIVERSYILCAVDHCWTLLYFMCSWPLLNAPIFSLFV